ncbi:MAG: hypothetical protein PWP76_502 [Candidatus Diapherotrites archaeon]|nr:hypothetical protein [Candidatus Diapherotrites archaeon]MDN5367032.1 hypothetical protein [Candidatus Diapherotrites archaeon]
MPHNREAIIKLGEELARSDHPVCRHLGEYAKHLASGNLQEAERARIRLIKSVFYIDDSRQAEKIAKKIDAIITRGSEEPLGDRILDGLLNPRRMAVIRSNEEQNRKARALLALLAGDNPGGELRELEKIFWKTRIWLLDHPDLGPVGEKMWNSFKNWRNKDRVPLLLPFYFMLFAHHHIVDKLAKEGGKNG